jgi:GNAT superfamily N-acetyltransferase
MLIFCSQTVDSTGELIGVVVCKLEPHRGGPMRGYIAMLAVKKEHRGRGIASKLVRMAMDGMIAKDADEVCLPFPLHLSATTCTDSGKQRSHWRLRSTTYLLLNSTNDWDS